MLDSNCAMAWWGQALVLGPNINMPMSEDAERDAYKFARRALSLAPRASDAERAYIEALGEALRQPGAGGSRGARPRLRRRHARLAAKRYPADPDAATLYAEALMNLRPWDLWTRTASRSRAASEITSKRSKECCGKQPGPHRRAPLLHPRGGGRREPAARGGLAPTASPSSRPTPGTSSTCPRTSTCGSGATKTPQTTNVRAIAADRDYIKKQNITGMYSLMYYPHNLQMRWFALVSQGRRADSIAAAKELDKAVPDSVIRAVPMAEFFRCSSVLTKVRFGLWEDILKDPAHPPRGCR